MHSMRNKDRKQNWYSRDTIDDYLAQSLAWRRIRKEHKRIKREKQKTILCKVFQQLAVSFFGPQCLVFPLVAAGFAVEYTHQKPVTVFVVNFFAILSTAGLLAFAVDEATLHLGVTVGGLLTSIFILLNRDIGVLKAHLLGVILQNLLLMAGLAFLLGGIRREEQYFNRRVAQTIGMFLLLAVLSLTIPTVSRLWAHSTPEGIVQQSRGTAVVIMVSYCLWLFFQLKTNRRMCDDVGEKSLPRTFSRDSMDEGQALKGLAHVGATGAAPMGGMINQKHLVHVEEEAEPEPHMMLSTGILVIICTTVLLIFNTKFAAESIQGIMEDQNISEAFMGIVILPLLSMDITALKCAWNDKMDMSLSLTLERCMQMALMVVPLVIIIAWRMGIDDMTLDFDGFSVASLFASIIIVTYVVQEGKSNWLTGALLIKVFVIIGLSSYHIDNGAS